MGTCWDWTIWFASWRASLKDELRVAQNLQGCFVTFCSTGITWKETSLTPSKLLRSSQCRENCFQSPAVSYQNDVCISPLWTEVTNSRLVCIAPAWPQAGLQRIKVSVLRNHTSMSQEVCMVNQNDSDFWQTDGTPDYLLVNKSKWLGIQGRNNIFSGNCIVLKPAGVFFPLIPSLLALVYTIGWTNNSCCIVL